ncbi:MAG: 50S ribosomal protein L29 [Flavobacteriales bacterium]|nr:50S ribosomal protein L29 [Flavobacteriales bacterium]|tara:strand:- start:9906 stop:10094 length:189 start_codon:yes stop_codon:yes gene_type:complete
MSNKIYKEMTNDELKKKLFDTKVDYQKMKLQHSVSQIENPSQIKFTRRNIARMVTELKKRDI